MKKGRDGLREFLDKSNSDLQYVVMMVRGQLSELARITLGALQLLGAIHC